MLPNNGNKAQYVYFLLSGAVALTIAILAYFSVRTTLDSKIREELVSLHKSYIYAKPSLRWEYNNSWRQIGNKAHHLIYSAYYDNRLDVLDTIKDHVIRVPIGSLRIFAILPLEFRDSITCIIRYENFVDEFVPIGRVQPMNEAHKFNYAPYSIMCPMYVQRNSTVIRLPQSVAIAYPSNRLSHLSPTFVPISYPRDIEEMFSRSRPTLSVCVGPLQQNYSDVLRIAEFIEMYRIQGAQHFYFYDLSATDDVKRLLSYYQREGIADVLAWNMPSELSADIHYAGIMAQINDCVYRSMIVDNNRYAAVVDLDEMLMPFKHNSLLSYLRQCDEGRTSAYVFRNVFFHRLGSNDTFTMPAHTHNRFLYTQLKVRRTLEILPAHQRSKCIVNTHAIIEMGNHFVWRDRSGYTESVMHHSIGLLFHYRDQCINCKAQLIVDYTARRFGSLIWDRVDEACGKVFTDRGLCPRGNAVVFSGNDDW